MADTPETRELALAAAQQASAALADLVSYARVGEGLTGAFDADVIELLLDAAKLAIEIVGVDDDDDRRQVYGAIARHLGPWA